MYLTIVPSFAAAIELSESITGEGFYECFQNVRAEDERFQKNNPELFAEWYVEAATGDVYHMSKIHVQQVLNKHTLHTSISSGTLEVHEMRSLGGDIYETMPLCIEFDKSDRKGRTEFFKNLGKNFFLA